MTLSYFFTFANVISIVFMELRKLSLLELKREKPEDFKTKPKLKLFFIADHIRSGHNIGALFRIADAFAFSKIYICGYPFEAHHPEVQKTALGATDTVQWEYFPDTFSCIQALKNLEISIIGVEQTNHSIPLEQFNVQPDAAYALVLGNEVKGLSDNILTLVNQFVEIPQIGTKHSINVSVAAGIVAWEFYKSMSR